MIKPFLIQFFLFFLLTSVGFGQTLSYDSIHHYYQLQLKTTGEDKLSLEEFSQVVNSFLENHKTEINSPGTFTQAIDIVARGQNEEAFETNIHFIESLLPKSRGNLIHQAFLYNQLGNIYSKKGESVKSLKNYLRASSLLENIQPKTHLGRALHEISLINMDGWNNDISLEYATKGVNTLNSITNKTTEDSILLMHMHGIMGVTNRRMRQFDEALIHIDQAIELAEKLDKPVSSAINNGNKATIFYEKGDYEKAIPLLRKDMETSIESGIYNSGLNAAIYLCWIYLEQGDTQSLKSTFEEMREIKEKFPITNPKSKTEFLKLGSKIAEMEGKLELANQFLKEYVLEDSIRDSINLNNDVASLHERHLMEQEISKLDLLQSTNQLQASHLKMRTALLIIIALTLIIVIWYVFELRKKNKKIDKLNEMLEAKVSDRTTRLLEINKELDTYLYRASHDIRRPIRTLLGLNNIAQINKDPEQLANLFSKVHSTAISMDKMLFKLQMAYELNNKHEIETVNIEELFEECKSDMALDIQERNAKITLELNQDIKSIKANKSLLRIALDNIIENAMLYQNHNNPEIHISTDIGNYYFYIHVSDNGYGIPDKYYEEIFNSYFKLSNRTQGSGLGLFLAHKAISYLAGEIVVNSIINEGSQFTIKIPVNPK